MKQLFLYFLGGLLPLSVIAQSEDELLPQVPAQPSQSNEVRVQQMGTWQQADITQVNSQYNQIHVEQHGQQHQLEATQQGQHNQWDITQEGQQHQFEGSMLGNHNQVEVQQFGQQNYIQQDLIGNGMDYSITQQGSQLELIQIEHNSLAPAYDVQQRGQGMRVVIEQGFSNNEQ